MSKPRHHRLQLEAESLEPRLLLATTAFDSDSGRITVPVGASTISLHLRGPGQGTVDAQDDGFHLDITGTTDRSSLLIRSTRGTASLTGLNASILKNLMAKSVVVEDATLNFAGGVNRLLLGDLNDASINIAEGGLLDQVTIMVGLATDVSITSGRTIKFIRAEAALNTDGITDIWQASAINRVRVKGEMQAELATTSWVAALRRSVLRGVEWSADHEEGSLLDWHQGGGPNAGGGIFNTGDEAVEALASEQIVHSGQFAARATINGAYLGQNGNRAVRLMRWTDKPWDQSGDLFRSPSYFSTWMYFPETYDPDSAAPGDGGWWNVFQFKSDDASGISQPMFSVNIGVNATGEMVPYLWAAQLESSIEAAPEVTIPSGEWVHFEAYYRSSPHLKGRITIYQNGRRIIDARRVQTVMPDGDESVVWGVGNYTNHIEGGATPGQATIFFDDAVVGSKRVSRFLPKQPRAPASHRSATSDELQLEGLNRLGLVTSFQQSIGLIELTPLDSPTPGALDKLVS